MKYLSLRTLAVVSLIVTIGLYLHPGTAMAQGKTQNISKKLANITTEPNVSSLIERSGVPGVSIAVIEDFAIDRLEVYGVENTTTQTPVSTQTLFQAASISKSLTAMIALRFVLEDRIALDEDIN